MKGRFIDYSLFLNEIKRTTAKTKSTIFHISLPNAILKKG